jgi:uncharacterized protein YhfF
MNDIGESLDGARFESIAHYPTFAFGDDPVMADQLADLVLAGVKTATSSLAWEGDEPLAKVGDRAVVLDSAGRPRCVIETVEIEVLPFEAVDAAMAREEGEGDRSLDSWRRSHWEFFGRICADLGREPTREMPVVFERFRVIQAAGELQQPMS